MKKQITIKYCSQCPYKTRFLAKKKYCSLITRFTYKKGKFTGRIPILPEEVAYIPTQSIRKDCPLNNLKK